MKVGGVIYRKVTYKTYEPKAYKLCISLKSCHIQLYQLQFAGLILQLVSCFTFSIEIGQIVKEEFSFKDFVFIFSSGGHLAHWSRDVLAFLVTSHVETLNIIRQFE